MPQRFGEACRVLARGRMNSALVEFGDGQKVVTSRNYLRRIVPREIAGARGSAPQ